MPGRWLSEAQIDRIITVTRYLPPHRTSEPDNPVYRAAAEAAGMTLPIWLARGREEARRFCSSLQLPEPAQPCIDKAGLAHDLRRVGSEWALRTHLTIPAKYKLRKALVAVAQAAARLHRLRQEAPASGRVSDAVEHLRRLLADPASQAWFHAIVEQVYPGRTDAIGQAIVQPGCLSEWLREHDTDRLLVWRDWVRDDHTQALHWLFGHALPAVYTRHFVRRAGRARPRNSRVVDGPFIRFSIAAAAALGVTTSYGTPHGGESVAKYLRCRPSCPVAQTE